jgi:DNA-directed RNA polymerase specialized sigma24 family protein
VRGHRGRYPLLTDEDLISLVGVGDAFAFTVLHDRHSRAIYSLARRLTGDEQDAEDLAQDAFLKVWRCPRSAPGTPVLSSSIAATRCRFNHYGERCKPSPSFTRCTGA